MPYKDPEKRKENARILQRKYRAANPEKYRARVRQWQKENSAKLRASGRRWYENNKDKARASALSRHYDNPRDGYNRRLRALETAAGRPRPEHCEVCGRSDRRIHFDHCHQRGVFRGWICGNCNTIIGHAHDDPDLLLKLAAYLRRTAAIVSPQLTLPGI